MAGTVTRKSAGEKNDKKNMYQYPVTCIKTIDYFSTSRIKFRQFIMKKGLS